MHIKIKFLHKVLERKKERERERGEEKYKGVKL